MPMHSDRTRRERIRRSRSDLDWFGEDPWADPDDAEAGLGEDDWYLFAPEDEDLEGLEESDPDEADWDEDPADDWGPIRRRRERVSRTR